MNNETKPNRIELPLPNGNTLVAEICPDSDIFPEITIYVQRKDSFIQDLALVRQEYESTDSEEGCKMSYNDRYNVLVWADENSEDYTDKFVVEPYNGDEDDNEDE